MTDEEKRIFARVLVDALCREAKLRKKTRLKLLAALKALNLEIIEDSVKFELLPYILVKQEVTRFNLKKCPPF